MSTSNRFQKLILGDNNAISEIDRSRIMFLARTIVVIVLISLFFLAYDIYLGYPGSLFVYIPFILVFGYALFLLKKFQYDTGRLVFLFSLNFFVYIVMSSIPEDPMSAIFYVAIMVVEYVVLGHEKKYWLFTLLGLTFILYLLDAFSGFSLLPIRSYDETTLQVNKVVDFVIAVLGILLSIKLLIDYMQYIIAERSKDNEELKQVNIELDKYSYTITHDLKGSIFSMLRLVELPALNHENYHEHVSIMKESLQSLLDLIEEVTEQARNRNLEIEKENFNIHQLVKQNWELVKYAPESHKVDLILDIPRDLEIKSDKRRMGGILNNLITNAIRYHDPSKDHQFVRLSGSRNNDAFSLTVEDNGHGIEKEHQHRVFDMFYRASNILGGSGLGLFIVKESVEKLSGSIELESKLGKGTIFKIEIPVEN